MKNIQLNTSKACLGFCSQKSEEFKKNEKSSCVVIPKNTENISKESSECIKNYASAINISFGFGIKSHRLAGTNVLKNNPDGSQNVSFSLWAPKAYSVEVEIRNPQDKVSLTPLQFKNERLKDKWAGEWNLDSKTDDDKSQIIQMSLIGDGEFKKTVKIPYHNAMYRFILKDKNGKIITKTKDPVSKAQLHIFSWSQVYDNNEYQWTDDEWVSGNNSNRVSDLANKPMEYLKTVGLSNITKDGKKLMLPSNLIAKEINISTLTKNGNIESAKKEIDKIAKDGIYNAILIMPVEGTYGQNWGYDGVDKYAVSRGIASEKGQEDAIYRNDSLKDLINYAHSKNLNVGMDWVPSHIFKNGPSQEDARVYGIKNTEKYSGNYLSELGPYVKPGLWGGQSFNLDDKNLRYRSFVRNYLVNMAMNWVDNYHVDFLRTDQTPEMHSNHTMKQVAQEIKFHFPHTVIHWEDHRTGDGLTRELTLSELPHNFNLQHIKSIMSTLANKTSLYNIGGNEHWDFNFSHALESILVSKPVMGMNPSMHDFANCTKDIGGTKYFLSHDEIGNDSGSRLMIKILDNKLNMDKHLRFKKHELSSERRIRALDAIHDLCESYFFDKNYWNNNYKKICTKYGIENLSKGEFEKLADTAQKKHKLAIGWLFMAPGSKMMFQGDEYGEINPFRFTRNQAVDEPNLEKEKGYKFKDAFINSKIEPQKHTINGIYNLSKEMSDLIKRNPTLQDVHKMEYLNDMFPHIDEKNRVIVLKRFDFKGNEVIGIYNFGDKQFSGYKFNNYIFENYDWKETINSNDKKYGGNGKNLNQNRTISANKENMLNIPANGFIILEKIK